MQKVEVFKIKNLSE